MAATTYHSTGAPACLRTASARAERLRELCAQDEHDAGVVREHAQRHQGPERAVDRVVHPDSQDVPAKRLLRGLPQDAGQERPRQRRARRHPLVGKVPVHDVEEHRAERDGERHEQRADPLGRHLRRREQKEPEPPEEVEDEDAREKQDAHHEQEDEVLADLAQQSRPPAEAEDVVEHEPQRGEQLAGEEQQDRRAEETRETAAPDDLGEGRVQLVLVHRDQLGELPEHNLGRRLAAQDEAGQRDDEEEDGHETRQEAERDPRGVKESPTRPEVDDRGSKHPHDIGYTTLLISPPSTCTTQPVMYDARSEARKTTMLANSSGVPIRPMGMSAVDRVAIHSSRLFPARAARSLWCPRKRSVRIRPGKTMLTVMPSRPSSWASVLNIPAMPGRIPFERMSASTGCLTELDWMARMRPHFFSFMSGRTARLKRTVETWTCSKAAFHCSSVICSKGPGGGPPTLATSTSIPPHFSRVLATTRSMSSGLLASAATASTSAPVRLLTSSAAARRSASPRAHIATRATSAPQPMAEALPMPLLAATTSATLPLSPRSTVGLRSGDLLVEVRAVAARHIEPLQLVVAHHLERDSLSRTPPPERQVQLLPRRHLLRVERQDDVALADARARARPIGHQSRHHDALVDRVREDAQPRPLRSADRAPVPQVLLAVCQVALTGDGERRADDLTQVEVDHAHHLPRHGEERAAARAGIRRARHQAPLEEIFPVRLELPQVRQESARHPPLSRPRGGEREDGRPAVEMLGGRDRHRREVRPLDLQQCQAQLEVLGHELRPLGAPLAEADLYGFAAHDHVVDGEDQPRGVDDDAAAHALVAEDSGRGMGRGHLGVDVHHRGQEPLDELDGGVHGSIAHASTSRRERATAEAESAWRGWGQHPRQEGLDPPLGVGRD